MMSGCDYCKNGKKFIADVSDGDNIPTIMSFAAMFGGLDDMGVAFIEGDRMWVDNSQGEYANLGFTINYCPYCGSKIEAKEVLSDEC